MKKTLLALIAAVSCMGAQALDLTPQFCDVVVDDETPAVDESRASGYTLKFCDNIKTWYTLGYDEYRVFLAVPAEMATALAGNEITRITFSAALQSAQSLNGTIFVTEDLDAEPVTESAVAIRNKQNEMVKFQSSALTTPYVIKENTPFYFGYTVKGASTNASTMDYPIGVDNGPANPMAGFIQCFSNGESVGFANAATDFGRNIFLYASTTGEHSSMDNVFLIGAPTMGKVSLPILTGGDRTMDLAFFNYGTTTVSSVEYNVVYNGAEPIACDPISISVGPLAKTTVPFFLPGLPDGHPEVVITVTKVNDIETNIQSAFSCLVTDPSLGFTRKFVVEEGTGTWCGWCPRGIVAFQNLEERHPESFLGIAVHSGDSMTTSTYNPLINKFFSGFPSCIVNRDPAFNIDPSTDILESAYNVYSKEAAVAEITLSTSLNEETKSVDVESHTVFALSQEDANYMLAFVLLENNISSVQSNNYAGGGNGAMGGWESYGSSVPWSYQHVARGIYNCFGIENSIPATIVKGEDNIFEYNVPLNAQSNVDNSFIVALLLDGRTGIILNAGKVKVGESNGINNVVADKANVTVTGANGAIVITGQYDKANVYTIGGVNVGRTTDLNPGLYIVNVDNKGYKVIVR